MRQYPYSAANQGNLQAGTLKTAQGKFKSSKVQRFKGSRKPHHELVNNYVDNRPPGEVREASAAAESRVLSLLNL